MNVTVSSYYFPDINKWRVIMPTEYVPCEVRTECLCVTQSDLVLRSSVVAQTLVASLSPGRPGFFLLPFYVRHVVGEVVLWKDFLRILRFSLSVLFHSPQSSTSEYFSYQKHR